MCSISIPKGSVDVVIGGTPCQSFSVTGLRTGIHDGRGNLSLEFMRIVGETLPRWVVWENVPGVLSSDGGWAFGSILGALGILGYGWAYRVLDARYFGVPQRRRRVYVVGHIGGCWKRAAATLFDGTSLGSSRVEAKEVQKTCARTTHQSDVLGWTGDETPKFAVNVVPTLRANQGGEGVGVVNGTVRRLTVTEWERLQGFADGYTDVGLSEKSRMRLLGNSFCVPVVRWIGERISFIEGIMK
jgi:DNA (cytosine-5)-methyltransferase 1